MWSYNIRYVKEPLGSIFWCCFSCSVWISQMQDAVPTVCEYQSYNQLCYAWYSYLKLLATDFSDGSCCPECGSTPATVVFDAAIVLFQRKMVLQESILNATAENKLQGR